MAVGIFPRLDKEHLRSGRQARTVDGDAQQRARVDGLSDVSRASHRANRS